MMNREHFLRNIDDECIPDFGPNVGIVLFGDLNAKVGTEVMEGVKTIIVSFACGPELF